MNISSIVIQVAPKHYDELFKKLKQEKVCDFHFGDKEQGKMVVTIEGKNVDEEIKKTSILQKMQNVLSAQMMQTYQEDLDIAIKEVEKADKTAKVLNDCVDVKDVKYGGDLRKTNFYGGV
jgi:nitrate reductase NapD